MSRATTKPCPACGAKNCRIVPVTTSGFGASYISVGPCAACGWCRHTTDMCDYTAATGLCERCERPAKDPKEWDSIECLPRPTAMADAEFRFRATMFLAWRTEPASGLRRHFEVFADWLADQGSSEEVAARADWKPYAAKVDDPKGWWQWAVPAGAGWVELKRVTNGPRWVRGEYLPGGSHKVIDFDRARLNRTYHNGHWWLCWPPGFVRLTNPLYHDASRLRVTVQCMRGLKSSRPVERIWPGGYTQLLCSYEPDADRLINEAGVVKLPDPESEDLGLFREEAA